MSNNEIKTHLAVLGAGPGGYAAAFMAADLGLEVTLIDKEENPGGACLYRGCIPSKAYLHAAKVIHEAREAVDFGIQFNDPTIDRQKLVDWKNGIVTKLTQGTGQLAKLRKIRYLQGTAKFTSDKTLSLENGETVRFDYCIIATGSRPVMPGPWQLDSDRVMDSKIALDMPDVPSKLLVIGAGYIGLELGSAYAALGSQVTAVEMAENLLESADKDLVKVLEKSLKKTFDAIETGTKVTALTLKGQQVEVTTEPASGGASTTRLFDRVLVAVGRRPNHENLGLEQAGIKINDQGFIPIDIQCRTSVSHIFAIGDITGNPMLAHRASHQGRLAAEVIKGSKATFEPNGIPAVMFTDPELAWVGLTEQEAKAKNIAVEVGKFRWSASGRALTLGHVDGLTKLIVDPKTHQLLGVGIVGPGAGEMIAEGTLAVEMGANAHDVGLTIHAHPTLSETVMEAADVIFGTATHTLSRKH